MPSSSKVAQHLVTRISVSTSDVGGLYTNFPSAEPSCAFYHAGLVAVARVFRRGDFSLDSSEILATEEASYNFGAVRQARRSASYSYKDLNRAVLFQDWNEFIFFFGGVRARPWSSAQQASDLENGKSRRQECGPENRIAVTRFKLHDVMDERV